VLLVSVVEAVDERALCERYSGRIRAYGLRHLRSEERARELVQHVLLSVLEALRAGRVRETERLDAYVFGTCRNAVMDMRRGDAKQRRIAERAASELPEGYEPNWPRVDRMRLEQCLQGLQPRDLAVVLATFVEDRDAEEIGSTLALTATNVRVIRHRAVARLQACVEATTRRTKTARSTNGLRRRRSPHRCAVASGPW
jgi:RNA polymerase sigma-70 factor (ECF subfamily)